MAETSAPWDGTTTGDATSAPYDAPTEWAAYWRSLSGASAIATNLGGVIGHELNELIVTAPGAASPAVVDTGAALAYGTLYYNSASVNVAIATPAAATRIDRIVLRKDWTAQTVRITRIAGVEGGGAPALTQTPGVTWDTPLAQVSITTGGVITLTDERQFFWSPLLDVVQTAVDIVSSNAETTIYDFNVPASTLRSKRRLRLTLDGWFINDSGAGRTIRIKCWWAGSVFLDDTTPSIPVGAYVRAFRLQVELQEIGPIGTSDAQAIMCHLIISGNAAAAGNGGFGATPDVDGIMQRKIARNSSVAQHLKVTAQLSASDANLELNIDTAVLEVL